MKKRRIVFRADAGKGIGYGHFVRSLALASYLQDSFDCYFASYNPDTSVHMVTDSQLDQITSVAQPFEVVGHSMEEFNDDFLESIGPEDIVVLDNYYFTTEYQRRIKEKAGKLVCVDDMHDRHMVCDLLLTVCPFKKSDFSTEAYTEFCGGIEYAFLREPFFKPVPDRDVKLHGSIGNVVMAMGGADAFDLTDKMIKVIHSVLPDSKLDVIAGETVKVTEKSRECATIRHNLTAEEIVSLFDGSDIGIFPASTICMEAFSRRLPVISGFYADNQEELYRYGVTHGYFPGMGNLMDPAIELEKRLKKIIEDNRPYPVILDFKKSRNDIVRLFEKL